MTSTRCECAAESLDTLECACGILYPPPANCIQDLLRFAGCPSAHCSVDAVASCCLPPSKSQPHRTGAPAVPCPSRGLHSLALPLAMCSSRHRGLRGRAAAGALGVLALLAAALLGVSAAVPDPIDAANLVQYWGVCGSKLARAAAGTEPAIMHLHTCPPRPGDLSFGASTALSSAQPVDLPGRLPFVALAAGRTHACGLLANGSALCMGDNERGALGVNASLPRSMAPLPVVGGLAFEALAAGWQFTCGQTRGGQLFCWGRNDFGQLCDGSTRDSAAPVRSAASYLLAAATAGGLHACGINGTSPSGSAAICWG